jgi:hypothetical protein
MRIVLKFLRGNFTKTPSSSSLLLPLTMEGEKGEGAAHTGGREGRPRGEGAGAAAEGSHDGWGRAGHVRLGGRHVASAVAAGGWGSSAGEGNKGEGALPPGEVREGKRGPCTDGKMAKRPMCNNDGGSPEKTKFAGAKEKSVD